MKKLLSVVLALAMILALTACGAPAAEPDPEPDPEPTSDAVEAAPEPAAVEGVVKEVSPDRIIITLADGSSLALTTSGIAGLEAEVGDTVRAEYTGEIGSLTASKVEVTAKAEKEIITVSGVVTKVDDEYVFLTLEDGTEAALHTVSMEEGEVEEGDTLTIRYADGGGTILSIDVTKAEKETGTGIPAAAPSTQTSSAQKSATGNASYTVSAVVVKLTSDLFTIDQDDGATMILDRKLFEGQIGRAFQVGDKLTVGYTTSGSMGKISYIELAGFDSTVSSGSYDDDDDDHDHGDEDDNYYDNNNDDEFDNSQGVYEAIRLINAERVKAGLPEWEINSELMEMAQVRADEMVVRFEHVRPDGSKWTTVFEEFGSSLKPRAENGGRGKSTASAQVDSWMSSTQGHRENILDSVATKVGVARHGNCWTMITAR